MAKLLSIGKKWRITRSRSVPQAISEWDTTLHAADRARDAQFWEKAASLYEAALKLDESRTGIWVQYGHMLKESGRLQEAADAYKKALELAPSDPDPLTHLAHLYKRIDAKLAADHFRQLVSVVAHDPDTAAAASAELSMLEAQRWQGSVFGVRDGRVISGWAVDTFDCDPVTVHVTVANETFTTVACRNRESDGAANGFEICLPQRVARLGQSARLLFPDLRTSIPGGDNISLGRGFPERSISFVDFDEPSTITGWLSADTGESAEVQIQIDGTTIQSLRVTERVRKGFVQLGFATTLPPRFFDGNVHRIEIRHRGSAIAAASKRLLPEMILGLEWRGVRLSGDRLQGWIVAERMAPISLRLALVKDHVPVATGVAEGFGTAQFEIAADNASIFASGSIHLEALEGTRLKSIDLAPISAAPSIEDAVLTQEDISACEALDLLVAKDLEGAFLFGASGISKSTPFMARYLLLDWIFRAEWHRYSDFLTPFLLSFGDESIAELVDVGASASPVPRIFSALPSHLVEAATQFKSKDVDWPERLARWITLKQIAAIPHLRSPTHSANELKASAIAGLPVGARLPQCAERYWDHISVHSESHVLTVIESGSSAMATRRVLPEASIEPGFKVSSSLKIAEFPFVLTGREDEPAQPCHVLHIEAGGRDALARQLENMASDCPVAIMSHEFVYPEDYPIIASRHYEMARRQSVSFASLTIQRGASRPSLAEEPSSLSVAALLDYGVFRVEDLRAALSCGSEEKLPTVLVGAEPFACAEVALPPGAAARMQIERNLAVAELSDNEVALMQQSASLMRQREAARIQSRSDVIDFLYGRIPAGLGSGNNAAELLIEAGRPDLAAAGLRQLIGNTRQVLALTNVHELNKFCGLIRTLGLEEPFVEVMRSSLPTIARNLRGSLPSVGEVFAAVQASDALAATLMSLLPTAVTIRNPRPLIRLMELMARFLPADLFLLALTAIDDSKVQALSDPALLAMVGTKLLQEPGAEFRLSNSGLSSADFTARAQTSALLLNAIQRADRETTVAFLNMYLASQTVEELATLTRTYSYELGKLAIRADEIHLADHVGARSRTLLAVLLKDRFEMQEIASSATAPTNSPDNDLALIMSAQQGDFGPLNAAVGQWLGRVQLSSVQFSGDTTQDIFSCVRLSRPSTAGAEDKGTVTVICSVHNPEPGLLQTVLKGLADQTYSNLDVVIVDDCSDDVSALEIRNVGLIDDRFRFHRMDRNVGPYECRNWVIGNSTSPFYGINDGDDMSHPERFAFQIARLSNSDTGRISTSSHIRFDLSGHPQLEHNLKVRADGPMTSTFTRSIFDDVGLFASVRSRGDVEFRERVRALLGETALLHEAAPLVYCLATPSSLSNATMAGRGPFLALWRDTFMRRAKVAALSAERKYVENMPLTVPPVLRP